MKSIIKDNVRYKGTKKQLSAIQANDLNKTYSLDDALALVQSLATAKFDETIELHYNLNIKQKHSIRDTVVMPHNVGKEVRVLVFAEGDKASEAKAASADFVGSDDLIQKIKDGWFDFDAVVATPDMMPKLATVAAGLGRRKLMPSPKTGNVTLDVARLVGEFKAGKIEVRSDKLANVHTIVGKKSKDLANMVENTKTIHKLIMKNKPSDLKGEYINTMTLTSTMGPGVRVDHKKLS